MVNNNSAFNSILGILGVLTLVAIAYHIIKEVASQTDDTQIVSDKALQVLQDPEQAKKLRQAVDKYHETGDWSKTKLGTIL